jgi:hypothetical protein
VRSLSLESAPLVEKGAEIAVRGKYTSTNVLPEDKTSMNFSDNIL